MVLQPSGFFGRYGSRRPLGCDQLPPSVRLRLRFRLRPRLLRRLRLLKRDRLRSLLLAGADRDFRLLGDRGGGERPFGDRLFFPEPERDR